LFRFLLILLIVFCAFDGFYLLPITHIPGIFNISDPGLLLILLSVAFGFLLSKSQSSRVLLRQPETWLVLSYLLLVLLQVSLAAFNYRQSLLSGLIMARHQFYYLAVPMFMLLLRDTSDYHRLLDLLSWLSLAIFFLSLFNYFGITIFHHRWAEGHGLREGVTRTYIPAMTMLGLATAWETAKWLERGRGEFASGLKAALLLLAHFFRQTRSQLFGALFAVLGLLLLRKRYGVLLTAALLFGLAVTAVPIYTGSTVVSGFFTSTVQEVESQTGTWAARLAQLEVVWSEFKEHPILGSGATLLRIEAEAQWSGGISFSTTGARGLNYIADLGYPSVLKGYGLLGVTWLVVLLLTLLWRAYRVYRYLYDQEIEASDRVLVLCALAHLFYILVSGVTINHFMYQENILMFSITISLIAVLTSKYRLSEAKTEFR
jgi:hypothetical protein